MQNWQRITVSGSLMAFLTDLMRASEFSICTNNIRTCRIKPSVANSKGIFFANCSAGLRKCKNKNSDIVSISEFLGGGEGGIRTLAPVIPAYSLSRGAPSAILGYFSISIYSCWRRERDSNPRCLSTSPVFKTGALNLSAISPQKRQRRLFYQIHTHMSIA